MLDFSKDRLKSVFLFIYCVVDYCGLWYVKEGRKEVKKYVVFFTCMVLRVVYFEVSNILEINSFFNVLYRFICRRGFVR